MITQNNPINMLPSYGVPTVVQVSQYDVGARTLTFSLYSDTTPYTPGAGSTASIRGTKPDGNSFSYPMTISGSAVSIEVQEQMTAVAGSVPCEITIEDSDGTVSSANFVLLVEKSPFDVEHVSETEIPILTAFVLGGQADQVFVSDGEGSGSWEDMPNDATWGNIAGTLSDQTDLQNALNARLNASEKGALNGVAELDATGRVPSGQLPAYVDDVVEYASTSAFPAEGESGKIYVALDTNLCYRWSGSQYVQISPSLALGETSATAYRGDRGKVAYDHSQLTSGNPHQVTKADVGLGNVDNTSDTDKPISSATQTALDTLAGVIAPAEVSPAEAAHSVGDFIMYNGLLYIVAAAIAIGDTLTVGTNIMLDGVGNELTFLRNAVLQGDIYSDWSVIKNMVAAGYGPMFYPVGTQFEVAHSTYTSILFDVVSHITPDSPALLKKFLATGKQYGMVLQMHYVIYSTEFDAVEAFYYAENGLLAGTYNVTITRQPWYVSDVGKTFQFTLASDAPAGSLLCWGNYDQSREGKTITVYANGSTSTAQQTATMTEGSGGTALGSVDGTGNFNFFDRTVLGSNDWEESGVRQWLNANVASGWFTPKTNWDRRVSYDTRAGFLYGFSQSFKDAIMVGTHGNRSNEVFDSHGVKTYYETTEKFFLACNEEVGFSKESSIDCGSVFDAYVNATNTDRIKYDRSSTGTARTWWLRTPYPSSAYTERIVISSGSLYNHGANYGGGVAPACVIG